MAKPSLKALQVSRLKEPGRYRVSEGLYLRVVSADVRSWVLRYMLAGKAREMGLGSYTAVSLETATREARRYREMLALGRDPLAEREAERLAQQAEAARVEIEKRRSKTFRECAEAYIKAQQGSWRNAKHRQQWTTTLEAYAFPHFGDLPVSAIDTALVQQALAQIWNSKTETATRVRGRIEAVFDWAKVQGLREGENPARWRGHLEHLLAKPAKLIRVKNHPAMPYGEVGDFMAELVCKSGFGSLALRFLVLTAARTGEVLGAKWSEIDLDKKLWTVPAERMKAGRLHRVPLSTQALAVLQEASAMTRLLFSDEQRSSVLLFPGRTGRQFSGMVMLAVMRDMGKGHFTPHGFRSTFRDWCAEQTAFPRAVAELALAHGNADKVEAAYLRSDLLDKRRGLMDQWGVFATRPSTPAGAVIPLQRKTG